MKKISTVFRIENLASRTLIALTRKAHRLGVTPGQYVQQLIEDDLTLDAQARNTPFEELAAPFRKAFQGMTEDEMDKWVYAARGPKRSMRRRTRSPNERG
jgi:hypothetical protein